MTHRPGCPADAIEHRPSAVIHGLTIHTCADCGAVAFERSITTWH